MDATLGLLAGFHGGSGGGVPSGGSVLTVSKEDENNNCDMLGEVSSSYSDLVDDDHDLELGLGLSTGGGRNTTDFAYLISRSNSSSSSSASSSSSVYVPNSAIVATERTAIDYVPPPNPTSVVGWPPIKRAHRMPISANRTMSECEEHVSRPENKNRVNGYLCVKVHMDGTLIGRKVDLNAHSSYEMLAQTLEDMFYGRRSRVGLLNGRTEFVVTYEDGDGDWMLLGDVPWPMFLSSVKRLRILKRLNL